MVYIVVLLVGLFSISMPAAADFDIGELYPYDQENEDLSEVYQEVVNRLFEAHIVPVIDKRDREVLTIKRVAIVDAPSLLSDFPEIKREDGEIKIPVNFLLFMDDFMISFSLLHSVGKPPSLAFEYIASLRCLEESSLRTTVDHFLGITSEAVSTHENETKVANALFQTLLLWLLAEQVAEDLDDQAPHVFAIELFRRIGIPPIGLGVYKRILSMLVDYEIGEQELESGNFDEGTLSIVRRISGENRELAALIEKHAQSLSRASGSSEWTESLIQDLYTLGLDLEDGRILAILRATCPNFEE